MIKRIGTFSIILISFLFLSYVPPIYNTHQTTGINQVEQNSQTEDTDNVFKPDYFASFIGQPIEKIINDLGEPTDIVKYNKVRQAMTFGESQTDFLQVDIDGQGNVANLFVGGNELPVGQFKVGMTLADVGDNIILQDQFEINFEQQVFQVELSGNDLNTKPLVKFDNGSFAMAHLDQKEGKVLGVSYYSKEMFLNNLPYRLANDSRLKHPLVIKDSADMRSYQERHLSQLLAIMSERQEMSAPVFDTDMTDLADKLLTVLIKKLPKVVDDDDLLTEWQELRNQVTSQGYLTLNQHAVSRLLDLANVSEKEQNKFEVLAVTPTDNLNLLLMALYGGEFGQQQLYDLSGKSVGIAISEGMLVLVFESNEE